MPPDDVNRHAGKATRAAGRNHQPWTEGGHDGTRIVGRGRPPPHGGDDAGLPRRAATEEQGLHYPADPPTSDEIIAVMRAAGDRGDGLRLRALIVLLWRAGMRISEALGLNATDLDARRGAIIVRSGKGGRQREIGMDTWGFEQLDPWLEHRCGLPVGALLCVIHGPTAGRHWKTSAARRQLHRVAHASAVRRRFAPHQLRHAHAVEMAHEVFRWS
jgi:site-specific recombinase XerC